MVAPLLAAGVAAPIIGGIYGARQAAERERQAEALQRQALDQFAGIDVPEYQVDLPYLYDMELPGAAVYETPDYSGVGEYRPESEQAILAEQSAMQGISLDPAMRAAQMQALDRLGNISQEGITAEDRFRLAQVQQDIGRQERGSREALTQQMASRGMAGSGLELAAQLSNQQAAAERARMEGLGIESEAQRRALDALSQQSSLAGQVRSQDFGEKSDVAKAQDAIAQFNAAQRSDTQARNIQARNLAAQRAQDLARGDVAGAAELSRMEQEANLARTGMRSNLMAQRYGQQMERAMLPADLAERQFGSQMQKASGQAGVLGQMAQSKGQSAQAQRDQWTRIGTGVGQGASAFGKYQMENE